MGVQIWKAWDGPRAFFHDVVEEDETLSKSLLFNAFIFMQVFNEINSRKILDEYNIFAGIHKSPIFLGVLAITAVLQVIIVQTPVSSIFHVHPLNGAPTHAVCRCGNASLCVPCCCVRVCGGCRLRLSDRRARPAVASRVAGGAAVCVLTPETGRAPSADVTGAHSR